MLIATLFLVAGLSAFPLRALADSTGDKSPTQTSGDLAHANAINAFVCTTDGLSATFTASNQQQIYSAYGLSIPPTANVTGIQVHLKALNDGTAKNRKLRVALSWNAGVNFTTQLQTRNLRNNYRDFFLGGSTYLWGRIAWTATEVSDANFQVQVVSRNVNGGGGNIQLDCIPVTVFYEIPGAPNLTVAKTANPDPVQPLQNLTYTITYGNTGASTATNTIVTDAVPANTTFVSASPAGQVVTQPSAGGTGTVTWNVGSVAVGATGSVTMVVKVNSGLVNGTQIVNDTYDIKSDQNTTPTAGNPVSTTVQGTIVLSLSKSDSPDPVGAGATLTYVLTTTNHSTTTTSTNVIVSEGFDPNVTYGSFTSSGCGSPAFDSVNFTWTIASLSPGATCTITITTTVSSTVSAGTLLVNTVDLIDDGGNTASASAITTVGTCGGSPNGTPCDDGNACTQTDTCQSGTCTGSNPVVCTASDQCHEVGTCNPANGVCSNPAKPNGSSCSDGNACTNNDSCNNGTCVSGGPTNCNDNNQCTDDSCNPTTGCVNTPVQDGIACGDANVCDGIETCQQGQCASGTPLNCNTGNACTNDSCDPTRGCIQTPIAGCCNTAADCADNSACTINERCVNHACTSDPLPCDDTNACTSDSCNPSSGCVNTPVANNTSCDDGNVCNGLSTCQNGTCQPGTPPNCNDGNACTLDTCDAQSGCIHQGTPGCCNSDADCADTTQCTINERCVSGQCLSDPLNCDDQNSCTADRCDPASGCVHSPLTDGQGCGGTNVCNGMQKCASGSCVSGTPLDCNDNNACTTDLPCDPATGCHYQPVPGCCTTDADCADTSLCTTNERCVNGACTSDAVNCDDGNVCTVDSCNPASGCARTNVPDGEACPDANVCNGIETCQGGICTSGTPLNCDDHNDCTTDLPCDPPTGCHYQALPGCCTTNADCADTNLCTINERCVNGSCTSDPLNCDDGKMCTTDSCDPARGCINTNVLDGEACGDADVCNGIETCQSGTCTSGTPLDCNDHNSCTTDLACDPSTGCHYQGIPGCCATDADCADTSRCTTNERCVNGACASDAVNCDDGNVCTVDSCNPASGCVHNNVADGDPCGDANVCNGIETCQSGTCASGAALDCNDHDDCTTDLPCDPSAGCRYQAIAGCCTTDADCADSNLCTINERCANGSCTSDPLNCDDGKVCTTDSCNPASGCLHTNVPSGQACGDANVCNGIETCQSGTCTSGTPLDCNDQNACTTDLACDPSTGCHYQSIPGCCTTDADCHDTSLCTTNERCVNGSCTSDPVNCNDNNVCTTDSCNPASGCVNTHVSDGQACGDANVCNGIETCQDGVCTLGTPLDCNDHNACTTDLPCDASTGCHYQGIPGCCTTDADCADLNACTINERCVGGSCTSGQLNCDDANACTHDTCDPSSGCVHTPSTGATCDDGNPCTSNDTCSAGSCVGTSVNCSDGDLCNGLETCLPNGQCGNFTSIPMLCAPGSRRWAKTCGAEWYIVNPDNLFGVNAPKQFCRQGDPTCDFDTNAATCTFHVAMCFRVSDPRLIPACTLSDVKQFSLTKPTLKKDATSYNALIRAVGALSGATTGSKPRDTMFTPPMSSVTCTSQVSITVPVGSAKSLGGKTLMVNGTKDIDAIKLKCVAP